MSHLLHPPDAPCSGVCPVFVCVPLEQLEHFAQRVVGRAVLLLPHPCARRVTRRDKNLGNEGNLS